jgi:hypothetical protein
VNKTAGRTIGPLGILCAISLFFVSRTEGFENIRAVQFILIFVAGVLLGLMIGILRGRREIPSA